MCNCYKTEDWDKIKNMMVTKYLFDKICKGLHKVVSVAVNLRTVFAADNLNNNGVKSKFMYCTKPGPNLGEECYSFLNSQTVKKLGKTDKNSILLFYLPKWNHECGAVPY